MEAPHQLLTTTAWENLYARVLDDHSRELVVTLIRPRLASIQVTEGPDGHRPGFGGLRGRSFHSFRSNVYWVALLIGGTGTLTFLQEVHQAGGDGGGGREGEEAGDDASGLLLDDAEPKRGNEPAQVSQ